MKEMIFLRKSKKVNFHMGINRRSVVSNSLKKRLSKIVVPITVTLALTVNIKYSSCVSNIEISDTINITNVTNITITNDVNIVQAQ